VNAGASEVAKVFLSEPEANGAADGATDAAAAEAATSPSAEGAAVESAVTSEADAREKEIHQRLQMRLKLVLMEFLRLSKGLLRKTRRLFLEDPDRDPTSGVPESTKAIWQEEMEIGYDKLMAVIYPYISQLAGAEALHRNK
jgi:hypothetical protein